GPGWEALVYFWSGGWIGVGRSRGMVPPHAHHAIQITIGLDGPVRLRHADEAWTELEVGGVMPDAAHALDGLTAETVMICIDPESSEGRWLRDSSKGRILAARRERVGAHVTSLERFTDERPDARGAATTITGVVRSLCAGPPP